MVSLSENQYYLISLSQVPQLGPVKIRRLVDFFGSAQSVFRANRKALQAIEGLSPSIIHDLLETRLDRYRYWCDQLGRHRISVVSYWDEDYPDLLKHIYAPPVLLFYRGSLSFLKSSLCIAVVGSRVPSHYGRQVTKFLSQQLSQRGVAIVSGLAWGIDSLSHQTALESGGNTGAVVAHSLDYIYPREHRSLAEKIELQGAIISEYALKTPPHSRLFPLRNRLISGLCRGVLLIEAKEKSGALITARWALEQNREVFAIPGSIFSDRSLGCHQLIQKGAKLVCSIDDILSEMGSDPHWIRPQVAKETKKRYHFSSEEQEVIDIIGEERRHVDEIYQKCTVKRERIEKILLDFEIKGIVQQHPGRYYQQRI